MDPTLLMAAAGLRARTESLAVLGNNIANAATAGYKADREFYNLFRGFEAEMPVVEAAAIDLTQGTLTPTAAPLDLALSGEGFFAVEGPEGVLYTRQGSFRRSAAGRLETAEGFAVRGENGAPIQLPAGEVRIGEDGAVTVADQGLGRLQVVEFASAASLVKAGHAYFRSPGANPPPAARTLVRQGHLEASNVNPALAAVRLVEVSRQFEMLTRAVALVANEMNRRAVEEIPRPGS
jgi:flagellar basal body rod protein FlgG